MNPILKAANFLHEKGIPIPLLRDKGQGSVSLTLLVVSFTVALKAVLEEKNSESLMYALALFGMCGSMYWGKKWHMRKIGTLDLGSDPGDEKKDQ